MPRDDVHNATDLVRVINNEVSRRVVHTITHPMDMLPQDRRATAPAQVADMALRSQLGPDEKTDKQLLAEQRHQPRLIAAASRARERGRFR